MEAIERSHNIPRKGWALAAVVHQAACHSDNVQAQIESALALTETLIYWERFAQAIQTLDEDQPILEQAGTAKLTARAEWLRGLALSRMARASQAAAILQETGRLLKPCAPQDEIMRWQCDMARVEMLQARYDQALTLAQASLDYFLQPAHTSAGHAAFCQVVIAAVYFSQGDYPTALEWLTQSLAGFQSAGWQAEQVRAQVIVAQVRVQQFAFVETVELCDKIRPTLESLDLPASLARCENTLGLAHLRQGSPTQAVPHFEHAREGFERAGIHAFAADSELNLGRVFYAQGDLSAAVGQYRRAQDLYQQGGHPAQVAHCEHNIGRCHREMGDYGRALDHFVCAESTFADLGLKTDLAICRHNQAHTYGLLGDWPRAVSLFEQALNLYDQLGLSLPAAECRTELALILAGQGQISQALAQIDHARQVCAQARYEPGLAICDRVAGDVLSHARQFEPSLSYYQTATQIFEKSGQLLSATLCDLGLAHSHFNLGNLMQAQAHLERASRLANEHLPDIAWRVEALRSQLAQARNDHQQALQAALCAVKYLGYTRRSLADESIVNTFLQSPSATSGSRQSVYDQAIQLALQEGNLRQTLETIEERRTQVIAGQLRWPTLPTGAISPRLNDLLHRRSRLLIQMAELRRVLQPGFDQASAQVGADDRATFERLREIATEYQETIAELNHAGWSAIGSPRDMPPFSMDRFWQAMKAQMAGRGWTCVSYAWLGDDLLILHLNDHGQLYLTRPALSAFDRMALRMMARPEPGWRDAVYASQDIRGLTSGETFRRRAYEVLVPPQVREELSPDRVLLVVPSGLLHNISFAALQVDDAFLTQQTILCATPSLQVLTLLNARAPQHGAGNRLLALAVDKFDDAPNLPYVADEIAAVCKAWPDSFDVLSNLAATPDALRQLSDSGDLLTYHTIHAATHAVFDGEFGRLSRLLLANGHLFVDDIRRLRLAADLVVLSACQTALGQVLAGDESVGLAYSFLAAGTQAVMASLWHINDPRTSDLMSCLYSGLKRGNRPATALALAQRSAIADGWPPYFWAAFTTIGLP
jgi:tetratricopeptide (TPR) repeat protein